jgi:hypothetical protein
LQQKLTVSNIINITLHRKVIHKQEIVEIMNGSACVINKRSIEEQRFVKWDEDDQ